MAEAMYAGECEQCGTRYKIRMAYFRARGSRFCSRKCFWRSRRKNIPVSVRKENKSIYDATYREKNRARLLAQKKAYYQANRDRFLALLRKRRESGVQKRYMRKYLKGYWTPERKAEKKDYDRKFRAKKFGAFADAAYLTWVLNEEIKSRLTNYEIRLKNGTYNKALRRGRNAEIKRGYT